MNIDDIILSCEIALQPCKYLAVALQGCCDKVTMLSQGCIPINNAGTLRLREDTRLH